MRLINFAPPLALPVQHSIPGESYMKNVFIPTSENMIRHVFAFCAAHTTRVPVAQTVGQKSPSGLQKKVKQ